MWSGVAIWTASRIMEPILEVLCPEPEGNILRKVSLAELTEEKLRHYWEKLRVFPTLFWQESTTFAGFVQQLFVIDHGQVVDATGIIWEVDDVGLFFITDIYPGYQATGHFTFWDRRIRGREVLIQAMIRYLFQEFGFHRLVTEVPVYSSMVNRVVRRVGFVQEGKLRKAVRYNDEWWDVNIYSILEEEIEDGIPEA